MDKLANLYRPLLQKADIDKNGTVIRSELDYAIENKRFAEQESHLVSLLDEYFNEIKKLSSAGKQYIERTRKVAKGTFVTDRTVHPTTDGISLASLQELDRQTAADVQETEFGKQTLTFSEKQFDSVDTNNNQLIDMEELEEALKRDDFSDKDRQTIEQMRNNYFALQSARKTEIDTSLSNGFSKGDLTSYIGKVYNRPNQKLLEAAKKLLSR